MKYIFLDVNGVLDAIKYNVVFQNYTREYEPSCFENLAKIIESTDAYIVVSSDLKLNKDNYNELKKELTKYKLIKRVLGTTPSIVVNDGIMEYSDRGLEIKEYLDSNPCDSFVIIDDILWDLQDYSENLVLTDPKVGLTEKDAQKAIEILNRVNTRR